MASTAARLPASPATPVTPRLRSSPSTGSDNTLTTPPSSIRQYSSALQTIMKQGLSSAMADMNDDARASERDFDREFGYGDEDPIDRHVRLFLTPRKTAPERLSHLIERGPTPLLHVEQVVAKSRRGEVDEDERPLQPFRPGLLHFRRTNSAASRGTPSLANDSYSTGSPYGDDVATPNSEWSEASFEAVKQEDMLVMYGPCSSSPSDLFSPVATPLSQVSVPATTNGGASVRSSVLSTCSAATLNPLRPSLSRPRPRVSPYSSPIPSPATSAAEEEEEWLSGRTVSEQMIAQAGLRCQRGRASRR